jgi:hypothetical protein
MAAAVARVEGDRRADLELAGVPLELRQKLRL